MGSPIGARRVILLTVAGVGLSLLAWLSQANRENPCFSALTPAKQQELKTTSAAHSIDIFYTSLGRQDVRAACAITVRPMLPLIDHDHVHAEAKLIKATTDVSIKLHEQVGTNKFMFDTYLTTTSPESPAERIQLHRLVTVVRRSSRDRWQIASIEPIGP